MAVCGSTPGYLRRERRDMKAGVDTSGTIARLARQPTHFFKATSSSASRKEEKFKRRSPFFFALVKVKSASMVVKDLFRRPGVSRQNFAKFALVRSRPDPPALPPYEQ